MSETLTERVLKQYKGNNRVFVETGTFRGGGIQLALDCGFEDVHSVEFDPERFQLAVHRFAGKTNVKIYHGDSSQLMSKVVANIAEPITFWLDGHSYEYAPLWDELRAIANHPIKMHNILIDDRHHWYYWKLDEGDIKKFILEINPRYKFTYEPNHVGPQDILVAYL